MPSSAWYVRDSLEEKRQMIAWLTWPFSPGAPFQWAAIFPKSDVSFINGSNGLAFYASDRKTTKYELPTKVSCAYCRTPIMDEGRNMCLLFPVTIHFGRSEEDQQAWKKAFEIRYACDFGLCMQISV